MASPELPRSALFAAAAAGDLATIAAYFAQHHVQDEVAETNAFVLAYDLSPLRPRGPRAIPWFHEHEISRRFTERGFLFHSAIENQQLEVLQWFFMSSERVASMGATLALLLPAIGHCAMFAGDFGVDVVELLLTSLVYEECLSAEQKLNLLNQFLISAARGDVMLPLLIAHGASVNYEDGGRFVEPLVSLTNTSRDPYAFRRRHRDLNHVHTLVDHGAFVVGSQQAISRGSYVNDPRVALQLLEMGADWRGHDAAHVLVDRSLVSSQMALMIPVKHGFADVDTQDEDGRTLLMLALRLEDHRHPSYEDECIIDMLLDHGIDVNLRDAQGRTALYIAVTNERLRETELLLEHGADPNASKHDGTRPIDHVLWLLPSENGWELLEILLEHGADRLAKRDGQVSVYEALLAIEDGSDFVENHPQYFIKDAT